MTSSEEIVAPILLVEDNDADAKLLTRKFVRAGVQNPIIHLANGDRALAYLKGINEFGDRATYPFPVLIVLDLKLPGISGLELLPLIRRSKEWKSIPVIVLTAEEEDRIVRGAYELGANSYLIKSADEAAVLKMAEFIRDYWLGLNRRASIILGSRQS